MNIIRNAFKVQGSWQYIVKIQYESHIFHEGDREEFLGQERCSQQNLWNAVVDSPLFELCWVNTLYNTFQVPERTIHDFSQAWTRSPKTGKVIYNGTFKNRER